MEEIIKKIELMLSDKIEKNIPCCEDSTRDYDAYNNLDKMYLNDKKKYADITIFNEYIESIDDLALKLDVDNILLASLFRSRHIPSKGLSCAIAMALNIEYEKFLSLFKELGYSFNHSDYDRIIEYFFINKIYDIKLLNDVLIHFGQMYLYSRKKLR